MDQDVADFPLKLRRDAVYLKIQDGIFFRSPFGDFSLKGKSIYNGFSALLPYLDGRTSEQALCEAMAENSRPAATTLLKLLVDRKIVYRIDPADRARVNPAVAECFRAQIDYLNHFAEDPGRRFLAFRDARVLLIGTGEALVGAGTSLLINGLAALSVASPDRRALDHPLWAQTQADLAERGAAAAVTRHAPGETDPAAFDLVVYCSAAPDLALLRDIALDRRARLLPAFQIGNCSYVGPSAAPADAGCWMCAMLRRSERVVPDLARDFWRDMAVGHPLASTAPLSSVAAQILGNSVALEAYKLLVDAAGPETTGRLLEQNLQTLETAVRHFLPHPACPRCAGIKAAAEADEDALLAADVVVARWKSFMGHDFGSYAAFADDDIEQLPISVTALPTRDGLIYGWSTIGLLEARARALGEAIRRDVIAGGALHLAARASGEPDVPPDRISGWLGSGDADAVSAGIGGTRLHDAGAVSIPAAALHPHLDQAGCFDSAAAGYGVAPSRGEATRQAVIDLFEHAAIEALADGRLPLRQWASVGVEADATTGYLTSIIGRLGAAPPRIAIGEQDGIAVAVAMPAPEQDQALAAGAIDLACAFTIAEAATRVLERHVARLQVLRDGKPWHDRPRRGAFMNLPVALPAPVAACPAAGQASLDVAGLAARLAQDGAALLTCDLTPPDVRATGSYIVIKALLLRAAAEV